MHSAFWPACAGQPLRLCAEFSSGGSTLLQFFWAPEAREVCARRGLFGDKCSLSQVQTELGARSDFALHSFAAEHGEALAGFMLPAERVYDAAKCCFLGRLLPQLKASLIACSPVHLAENNTLVRPASHLAYCVMSCL